MDSDKQGGEVRYIKFDNLNDSNNLQNLHPKVTDLPSDERSKLNGSANDPSIGQQDQFHMHFHVNMI